MILAALVVAWWVLLERCDGAHQVLGPEAVAVVVLAVLVGISAARREVYDRHPGHPRHATLDTPDGP